MKWPTAKRSEHPAVPGPPGAETGPFAKNYQRPENEPRHQRVRETALVVCSVILGGVVVSLVALLWYILPLQKTIPYFITFHDRSRQLVEIEPLIFNTDSTRILIESVLHAYVVNRHSIIAHAGEMDRRWFSSQSFLAAHSSQRVYNEFLAEAGEIYEGIRETPIERRVEITNAIEAQSAANEWLWHLEFETVDRLADTTVAQAPLRRAWTAYVRSRPIQYESIPTRAQTLANPLGLVITEYRIGQRLPGN